MSISRCVEKSFMVSFLALAYSTLALAESGVVDRLPSYKLKIEARAETTFGTYNMPAGVDFTSSTPVLNNNGQLALNISLTENTDSRAGIWFSDKGIGKIVHLAPSLDFLISDVQMNDKGQMAFSYFDESATRDILQYDTQAGVLSNPVDLLPQFRYQSPHSFTNAGDLLLKMYGGFRGEQALYLTAGGELNATVKNAAYDRKSPYSYIYSAVLNNKQQMAAHIAFANGRLFDESKGEEIRLFNQDGSSRLIAEDHNRNPQSPFRRILPSIGFNDHGWVVFTARLVETNKDAIVLSNGMETKIIAVSHQSGLGEIESFAPSLNNSGLVTFRSFNNKGERGIYVANGKAITRLVGEGDVVETDVGPAKVGGLNYGIAFGGNASINNRGDVAFQCGLSTLEGEKRVGNAVFVAYAE